MKSFLIAVVIAIGASPFEAHAVQRLVAVLPLNSAHSQIVNSDRVLMDETVRTVASNALTSMGFTVLTSDTTLRLLTDNGVDLDRVCDANCPLDAGREMKAALVVAGTLVTTGEGHVAFVRLLDTASGKQISSVRVAASSALRLERQLQDGVAGLFAPLAFEHQQTRSRRIGLAFGAGTVVAGVVAVIGYTSAVSTRHTLLSQSAPVDLTARNQLITRGERANTVGVIATIAGVTAGAISIYFLSGSF